MIQRIAMIAMLSWGLGSCTRCSQSQEPEADAPADTVEAPQDEVHSMAKPTGQPDEDGAIFEKKKVTPVQILKMKEIENDGQDFAYTKDNTDKGKAIYMAQCSRCHGVEGRGDGPEERQLSIAPTNLREWELKFGSSIEDLVYTINYGRSEGEMPAFRDQLSEEDIWTVAYYVEAWVSQANP
ncbi:c-type cytochrome [Pseudobacteriovorax antillogorgiicola]|uniref:Cytochrome c, mono-and diheme variants n=1 Tax=Pseudobacteriovorax antillogorgiicola TaxID=1513793 RepID=A0A1Y6C7Z0_9BACT|nr:cytochrome c [Pseudobacteriovorax antillogorgiicola]TCS51748.1 mono/diheme cytochrome c family protein [Pseudobacteriovorax antillogorgiicola]SMF49688.1 Cytochrome c, mono-and diheme variants [Pseudobacteriovorax antillogorgiicola]